MNAPTLEFDFRIARYGPDCPSGPGGVIALVAITDEFSRRLSMCAYGDEPLSALLRAISFYEMWRYKQLDLGMNQ